MVFHQTYTSVLNNGTYGVCTEIPKYLWYSAFAFIPAGVCLSDLYLPICLHGHESFFPQLHQKDRVASAGLFHLHQVLPFWRVPRFSHVVLISVDITNWVLGAAHLFNDISCWDPLHNDKLELTSHLSEFGAC